MVFIKAFIGFTVYSFGFAKVRLQLSLKQDLRENHSIGGAMFSVQEDYPLTLKKMIWLLVCLGTVVQEIRTVRHKTKQKKNN